MTTKGIGVGRGPGPAGILTAPDAPSICPLDAARRFAHFRQRPSRLAGWPERAILRIMIQESSDPGLEVLERGRRALVRGAWEEAVDSLRAAAEESPADATAWELLGTAHMWRQETDSAIEARQQAYALYRDRGDDLSSARVALELAEAFFEARGEAAVANGWLQRARRLLEELPPSGEHALLKVWDCYMVLMGEGDPATAEAHAAEGVAIARKSEARDVGILALALQGLSQVGQGRAHEGLDLLDEAAAAAMGGEVTDPQWFYLTCCCMIDACDQVRDYERSMEWCHRLREFCDRWQIQAFRTACRIKYTGALLWRGEWVQCEEELERAVAELRRRQGRLDRAEELLEEARGHPMTSQVRAELALDRDDPASAAEIAEALLRRLPESARTERVAALEILVRAQTELKQVEEARTGASELTSIADQVNTPALRAASLVVRGLTAGAALKHEEAKDLLEDAVHLFEDANARFAAARARLDVARSLAALGRDSAALSETRTALRLLEEMGAEAEAERARRLLDRVESGTAGSEQAPAVRTNKPRRGPLTRRQREVLALVAEGLSDREIAARLYLSEHTVHRHMANLMSRLEVNSRSAAVARGVREGLI